MLGSFDLTGGREGWRAVGAAGCRAGGAVCGGVGVVVGGSRLFAVDGESPVVAARAVEPVAGGRGAGCWRVGAGLRGAVLAGAPCSWLFVVVVGAERGAAGWVSAGGWGCAESAGGGGGGRAGGGGAGGVPPVHAFGAGGGGGDRWGVFGGRAG